VVIRTVSPSPRQVIRVVYFLPLLRPLKVISNTLPIIKPCKGERRRSAGNLFTTRMKHSSAAPFFQRSEEQEP